MSSGKFYDLFRKSWMCILKHFKIFCGNDCGIYRFELKRNILLLCVQFRELCFLKVGQRFHLLTVIVNVGFQHMLTEMSIFLLGGYFS